MSFLRSEDDLHTVAHYKRVFEYFAFDKEFAEDYQKNPSEALMRIGVDIKPEDIGDVFGVNDKTDAAAAYKHMFDAKMQMRDNIRENCKPDNEHFAKWRDRQINRCAMQFSDSQAKVIIHASCAFEISSGCSVGCKFCGLNSGPLSKVFFATDENKKLWSDVVDTACELIGKTAVGEGMCYFGTEPLDNPDYEFFMEDWRTRFGKYSQITTAVATRNTARTRQLISKLSPDEDTVFRFSVKSMEEFRTIMEVFTPEELLLVELIPQFEEAPGNRFTKVGRNVEDGNYGGTISCTSGFLINMCDQTIKLLTPVNACERFPLGQVEVMCEHFDTAEDFREKLQKMIDDTKTILSPKETLKLYDYLNYQINPDDTCAIFNPTGYGIKIENAMLKPLMEKACAMLKEGGHTRKEIGEAMCEIDNRLDPVSIYSIINKLWNSGVIEDKQLFGD